MLSFVKPLFATIPLSENNIVPDAPWLIAYPTRILAYIGVKYFPNTLPL